MNTFIILSELESNIDLHLSRLLILLVVFAGRHGNGTVDGLTKLAKLDFLLRYPSYLERALQAKNVPIMNFDIADFERKNVESTMVRFKYGPWDFRYRNFLNILVGKGLVDIYTVGRTIKIGVTSKGIEIASELINDDTFQDLTKRAQLIKQNFNIGATSLMKFIYSTFPEISDFKYGEEITDVS